MHTLPDIAAVAKHLLGKANSALSKPGRELRFGTRGSLAVDLRKGVWHDHERGEGGGVLDLVMHEGKAATRGEAAEWLKAHGFDLRDEGGRSHGMNGASRPARKGAQTPRNDAGPRPKALPSPGGKKLVKAYDYTSAEGAVLYQVVRWEPKGFSQRRSFRGTWAWGITAGTYRERGSYGWTKLKEDEQPADGDAELPEIAHQLYRLPELQEALALDQLVFVCEGEKDVDTLRALGVSATTNSGGARYWTDEHAAEFMAADVVIVGDNDAAGRDRIGVVSGSLARIARRVRVLDVGKHWQQAGDKEDITDWFERGGLTREQLDEIVARLPDATDPERWKSFLPPGWNALDIPPRDWLLQDLLCTTSRWLVVGETGVGKTLLLLDMAHAICKGVGFLNWQGVDWREVKDREKRPFRVMYLDGELPAETMKERIAEASRLYGEDLEVVVYNRDRLGMDELPPLNTEAGREWLKAEIEAVTPDCIILDNVMALLSGKMDDEQWEAVKPLIAWLMARRVAQIWVHHPGHDTSRGFGTKTREWHMDVVINLTREGEGEGGEDDRIRLKFTKARMKRPETAHLYRELVIRRTPLGWATEAAPRKNGKGSKLEMIQAELLSAIADLDEGAPLTPSAPGGPPVRKVKMRLVADYLKRNGTLQTIDDDDPESGITNADRQALNNARLALKRRHKIGFQKPYIWRA